MVTIVGLQNNFADAIRNLLELDYDAVEAYNTAIEKLENSEFRKYLTNFRDDHLRHIKELTGILIAHSEPYPSGPGLIKPI